MKKILVAVSLMTLASTAFAAKDCGELKNEIAAELDAKGVAHYSLEIVDKGASADGKWSVPAVATPKRSFTSAVNPTRTKKPTLSVGFFTPVNLLRQGFNAFWRAQQQ